MMKSLAITSLVISLALLAGRISGLAREVILAAKFGASETADVAVVMLTLPDFMVGLLLAGGFSAALIPELKRTEKAARVALIQKVIVLVTGVFSLIALAIALFPSLPLKILAPGLSPDGLTKYSWPLILLAISLPLSAATGATAGYLNVKGKFTVPALGTLVFNVVLCAYLLAFYFPGAGLIGFALAIVTAAFLRLFSQMLQMPETLRGFSISRPFLDTPLLKQFAAGVVAFSLIIGTPIVFRTIYSIGGDGNLALFNYALKLFDLPSALILAPIVTVLLPKLSGLAKNHPDMFNDTLTAGLQAVISISFVAVWVGLIFGDNLAQLIYLRGNMTLEDVAKVAIVAKITFLALPFLGVLQVSSAALNAQGKTTQVLINTAIAFGVAMGLVLLIGYLGMEAGQIWMFVGFYFLVAVLNLNSLGRISIERFKAGATSLGFQIGLSALLSLPFYIVGRFLPAANTQIASLLLSLILAAVLLVLVKKQNAAFFKLRRQTTDDPDPE